MLLPGSGALWRVYSTGELRAPYIFVSKSARKRWRLFGTLFGAYFMQIRARRIAMMRGCMYHSVCRAFLHVFAVVLVGFASLPTFFAFDDQSY
ncbi:hypothetical protein V8B97DRAFT_1961915 [Scleroderma yunnanense]